MSVYDRWHKTHPRPDEPHCEHDRVATAEHGCSKRWQVRYRDDDGQQRKRNFTLKTGKDPERHAEAYARKIGGQLDAGTYFDPRAGRVTLREYAEAWMRTRTFGPTTRANTTSRLNKHIIPSLGGYQLRQLAADPSIIAEWVVGLPLAASSTATVFADLSGMLSIAADDGVIPRNPCQARVVRLPNVRKGRVVPWEVERVAAVKAGLPPRFQAFVDVGAGAGLRQGEIFGLSPADVDRRRGLIHVRRQVRRVNGATVFALPKRGKERDVPLSDVLDQALTDAADLYRPRSVTLPWDDIGGEPTTVRLQFTDEAGGPLYRARFTPLWKVALVAAGVIETPRQASRRDGTHALRHFFASITLHGGTSIRELSEWLGHGDPGFTLRVYTHLIPAGADRAREAIDAALSAMRSNSCAQKVP